MQFISFTISVMCHGVNIAVYVWLTHMCIKVRNDGQVLIWKLGVLVFSGGLWG